MANDIVWKAPVRPGPETAVVYGDPTKPGPFVLRVKFPPGLKVMPHSHPDEWRTAVVLSGTYYFATGEQWDETKLRPYPAGTFLSEPKGAPHFVWAKDGEVIVQFTAMGPTGTTFIPQKQ
jgi:quercetin dioxygenase-like cupin family protein